MVRKNILKKIHVNVDGGRAYDILIGHNILNDIGLTIKDLNPGTSVYLITSPRIGGFYEKPLVASLNKAGYTDIRVHRVPDGEKYKDFNSYKKLLDDIIDFSDDEEKKIFIVNLGGGVVGDLGGHLAATYRRGIGYIQVWHH